LHQLGKPPIYKIAENIENIQRDINRICWDIIHKLSESLKGESLEDLQMAEDLDNNEKKGIKE